MSSSLGAAFCMGCVLFSIFCPAHRYYRLPLWSYSLAAAFMVGIWAGFISLLGTAVAAVLATGLIAAKARAKWLRWLGWGCALVAAFLLGAHKIPGFLSFTLATDLPLQNSKPSYSIVFHLDKAIAGVLLLRMIFVRIQWRLSLYELLLIFSGLTLIYAVAWSAVLQLNVKFGWYLCAFIANNLLVTCLAEEAFFRGLLQKPLMQRCSGRSAVVVIIMAIGVLFAAVHGAALTSWPFAVTYFTAGVVYAAAYQLSGRLEVSIALHFLTNLLHIIFFDYPGL